MERFNKSTRHRLTHLSVTSNDESSARVLTWYRGSMLCHCCCLSRLFGNELGASLLLQQRNKVNDAIGEIQPRQQRRFPVLQAVVRAVIRSESVPRAGPKQIALA